jgi:hypothetical protein
MPDYLQYQLKTVTVDLDEINDTAKEKVKASKYI